MSVTEYPTFDQIKGGNVKQYSVESSSVVDDVTEFTFNQAGMAQIMSTLTSLYSNPEKAVLREYVSNGIDSHVVAGTKRPVEITMPTPYEPTLIVQDFGTGMSSDEMRTIYTSYGLSTKQNDMSQIGNFGYGSKSALALADQFTVVSVKDGTKTVAVISREESGIPAMNILSADVATSADNGVTVKIPVRANTIYKFEDAAREYLFTVPEDKAIALGSSIPRMSEQVAWTIDSLKSTVVNTSGSRSYALREKWFRVIMGGVSYHVDTNALDMIYTASEHYDSLFHTVTNSLYSSNLAVYAEIPIASLDLTPSREEIQYTPRTMKFLRSLGSKIAGALVQGAKDDLSKCTTREEVIDFMANKGGKTFIATPFEWNDEQVAGSYQFEATEITARINGNRTTTSSYRARIYPFDKSNVSKAIVLLEGPLLYDFKRNPRKNVLDHASFLKKEQDYLLVEPEVLDDASEWVKAYIASYASYTVEEIMEGARSYRKAKAAEYKKNNPSAPRTEVEYPVFTLVQGDKNKDTRSREFNIYGTDYQYRVDHLVAKDIPTDALLFSRKEDGNLISETLWDHPSAVPDHAVHSLVDLGLADTPIVVIDKNRKVDAFLKRIKWTPTRLNAKITENVTNFFDDLAEMDETTIGFTLMGGIPSTLVYLADSLVLDDLKIEDEDARKFLETAKGFKAPIPPSVTNVPVQREYIGESYIPVGVKNKDLFKNIRHSHLVLRDLLDKYPLLDNSMKVRYNGRQAVLYMNAVHNDLNRKDS